MSAVPTRVPDRYADAVRARRRELRAAAALLTGSHRTELRGDLAACRLAASAELATALAALERELRQHADRADRRGRAALPDRAARAVDRLAARSGERWVAAVLPAVRRVAAARGLPPPVPWPGSGPVPARAQPAPPPPVPPPTVHSPGAHPFAAVLARPPTVTLPVPDPPPGVLRAVLAGATAGWRPALLPAAVLPAVGLPALGGPSALPLAVGLGLALLVLAVRTHRVAADRARLRRWSAEVVSTVRAAFETEFVRRLLDVERLALRELDDAVARRRTQVDRALRELAPEPVVGPRGATVEGTVAR